ncbi:TIGR02594 family protein [Microbulbifer sp. OS29]|uniref:TIGR02594 family protein n=1 Tax=Microbulbifer okhotskensis TaxID=2926617 RepID=A0A9X2J7Q5_9GAMM|nr:TIGR02594 family protein [Microbulbifer okhotskensis]MCO1336839.1 TIGR02594 family protein [Microbulbifer okhotskensis]
MLKQTSSHLQCAGSPETDITNFCFIPWMRTAYKELDQSEVAGVKANPRILQYFSASKFWGTDDSGGKNAWCASFVAWVMKEHGYTPVKNAFRAKSWKAFGKSIGEPIQGAIAIKSRKGGGHVGFVVGKSPAGKHLFILGGNQDDKVSISQYPISVWETFVVPSNFDVSNSRLPIYTSTASVVTTEA